MIFHDGKVQKNDKLSGKAIIKFLINTETGKITMGKLNGILTVFT